MPRMKSVMYKRIQLTLRHDGGAKREVKVVGLVHDAQDIQVFWGLAGDYFVKSTDCRLYSFTDPPKQLRWSVAEDELQRVVEQLKLERAS